LRGWLVATHGEPATGLGMMRRGLAAKIATGSRLKLPYYRGLMAELLVQIGRMDEARGLVEEGLSQAERTGERWFLPELLRLRASMLARTRAGVEAAEQDIRHAICIAHAQGARLWEQRAIHALAQLRTDRGRHRHDDHIVTPKYPRPVHDLERVD